MSHPIYNRNKTKITVGQIDLAVSPGNLPVLHKNIGTSLQPHVSPLITLTSLGVFFCVAPVSCHPSTPAHMGHQVPSVLRKCVACVAKHAIAVSIRNVHWVPTSIKATIVAWCTVLALSPQCQTFNCCTDMITTTKVPSPSQRWWSHHQEQQML